MRLKISPTSLAAWDDCQLKFYYKANEIEPVKVPESEDILAGRDIHEIIRDYYKMLMSREYELTEFEIRSTLIELAEKRMIMPLESEDYIAIKLRAALNNFVKIELERIKKFGLAKLLAVEERAEKVERIADDEIVWTGIVDAVWDIDGVRVGYDWKTGFRYNVITKYMIYQATIYSYLFDLDKFYFVFLPRGVMVELKDLDFEEVREKVRSILRSLRNGELRPNLKSCENCEYNLPCKAWEMGIDLLNY